MVGLVVVTSCSGVDLTRDRSPDTFDVAEAVEHSPCGGGDLRPMTASVEADLRDGFELWPLPPVFISGAELGGDAVACFDGDAVLVNDDHDLDRVIIAHEWCHAIAYLFDRTAPWGFPSPSPQSPRARALEPEVWHQEIWAVTCSTAVTGAEDWSWGHLVHDTTDEALMWAAAFVAAGPDEAVDPPPHWTPAQTRGSRILRSMFSW